MKHKILIIDDEESVLLVLRHAFHGHCEVLTALSGEEGLELIERERPFLVFLDISLPGISGIDVLERIKGLGLSTTVWMLTGNEDLETAVVTLKGGASGYLTKPFDMERLRGVVMNALVDISNKGKKPGAEDKPWHVEKPDK